MEMSSRRSKLMAMRRRRRSRGRRAGRGRESVRVKVQRLRQLVPGSRGLRPDRLFLRTADFIMQLRSQVNLLQALSNIYKP